MAHKSNKVFLIVAILGGAVAINFLYGRGENNSSLIPDIYVSSYDLVQADTLLVVVKNEPEEITAKLGSVKMHFFRSENNKDWVSIVGIAINKTPGDYRLLVDIPGRAIFEKSIAVSKREFRMTKMLITPKLSSEGYTAEKIIENIENKENNALKKVLDVLSPTAYFNSPFIYPLSEIGVVGLFGDIRATENYQIQHLGVDLKASISTPVYAVNNGRAVFIESLPDYGNTIIIDHGLGIYSLYLHLAEFKVAIDQMVEQGDLIGLSGDTGYSISPHLHFSIKVRGAALDPLRFIKTTQAN